MSPDPSVLIAQLREALTQQRYNPVVIGNYCRNADYFLSYLTTREIALETVTPTDVADYLRLSVRQFRKRHGRAPARYWIGIPRSGIHGLLKLALKRWPPEPARARMRLIDTDGPSRVPWAHISTARFPGEPKLAEICRREHNRPTSLLCGLSPTRLRCSPGDHPRNPAADVGAICLVL